ncbi:MAG: hypothetical protein LCH38_06275 [Proteobacteria bacterium]|nr:hypothetical protein [Pseudomonadota bacterium]
MSLLRDERLIDRINSPGPDKRLVASVIACVLERREDALDRIMAAVEEHGLEMSVSLHVVLEAALRLSAFYESLPRPVLISILRIATQSDESAADFAGFLTGMHIFETEEGVRLDIGAFDARWWPAEIPLNS